MVEKAFVFRKMFQGGLGLVVAAALTACSGAARATPLPTVVLDDGGPASSSVITAVPESGDAEITTAVPFSTADTFVAPQPAGSGGGLVSASAEVVPHQSADLSFSTAGVMQEALAAEGDAVHSGDVLAALDSRAQLQSALAAAQKTLDSAQQLYNQAMSRAPAARAQAQLALVQAQQALDDAQKAAQSKEFQRASPETIDIARARLITANQALDDAESAYNQVAGRNREDVVYASALSDLAKARQNQLSAQYTLNYVMGLPAPLDIEEASANVALAEANLLAAKADWDAVKDDFSTPEVAAAEAQVAAAQSGVAAAQAALDRALIKAPFDGVVAAVSALPGQAVAPGQAVLTLANPVPMQVETTDLSERDIPRVAVGQRAAITVEALGQTYAGQVTAVAQRATKIGGDVVYKVTVQFDQPPAGLRWGMSATVQIGGQP
jgi:HlyD family secretion protein